MADTKLTTVKILKEIYSNFKKTSFDTGTTLQKLVNRSMDRYVNEDDYRINGYPIEEIERKDAVILSKIAQHINPNTKYKNVSTSFKLKGY